MSKDLIDIDLSINRVDECTATVVVYPLRSGYGHTVGNALRRMLIASVSGIAPYAVMIEGAPHEYMVLEHVQEDVMTILMHIRGIVFQTYSDQESYETILTLSVKGPKVVTAADLVGDHTVSVFNKHHVIAHVFEYGELTLQVFVKRGMGYMVRSQEHGHDDDCNRTIGQFLLDGSYSPVERVIFNVDKVRYRASSDYEKLTLSVTTNGSILPEDVIRRASSQLTSVLSIFVRLQESAVMREERAKREAQMQSSVLAYTIEYLELPTRASNCLIALGVSTIGDLTQFTYEALMKTPNLGKKSLNDIVDGLLRYGLVLRQDEDEPL
jgi:DNA-directed RNA polymerase subunit alpha